MSWAAAVSSPSTRAPYLVPPASTLHADGFATYGAAPYQVLDCAPALKGVAAAVGAYPRLQAYFARRAAVEAAEKAEKAAAATASG